MSEVNNTPLVSILIPVYNVEKYIERCARSVFEQTYENLEYIFVDDCTPDNSIAILNSVLKEYSQRASHVRIIKHEQNEGIAVGRNTAISNATGDFVFFVDSDDYIEKGTITTLVNLQRQTNADIVTGRMYIDEDEIDPHYIEPLYKNRDEMLLTILNNIWHHEITNRLMRRSLFIDNEIKAIPYVNVCEDWQLIAKVVFYANTCVTADSFTYHYVSNPSSLIHSNTAWINKKTIFIHSYSSLQCLTEFFEGSLYEEMVWPLMIRSLSNMIDLSIRHHDKEFFQWCRTHMFLIPSKYYMSISKKKLTCVKLGFRVMNYSLSFYQIINKYSNKNNRIMKLWVVFGFCMMHVDLIVS